MPFMSDKKRAIEGDVVELLADLPKSDFKRGYRGVVITSFEEPSEAYDLEIIDKSGTFIGLAYSVKVDQFENLSRGAFVRAMAAVERCDWVTAERELGIAIDLRPGYIGSFVNSILVTDNLTKSRLRDNVDFLIPLLRIAVRVDPTYEIARINLAIAFLNFGVANARQGKLREALDLFYSALGIKTDDETESKIRTNIVRALTSLGESFFRKGRVEDSFSSIRGAFLVIQDETTRRRLGVAFGNLGLFYMKAQNFDLAIQSFERAEDSGVVVADFLNDYGICLVYKNRVSEATRVFERALEIDSQNELARVNLLKLRNGLTSKSTEEFPIALNATANEMTISENASLGLDGSMPEALEFRPPMISARDWAPIA
jgi:tetratricopeptide (TPR) repeat protein